MQTFKKHERLSGEKVIDTLFAEGKSFTVSPFRIIWNLNEKSGYYPAQILISVPKKKIKNAADRNLVKRRIREAYRKNKDAFYEYLRSNQINCAIAVLYNSNQITEYHEIEGKIILLLKRFQSEYEKSTR